MILDAAQEFERLQAVDAELFEEVVIRRERARRHVEMLRGQVEYLLRGLVNGAHGQVKFITILGQMKIALTTAAQSRTRPRRMPVATASARVETPSLPRIEPTWNLAV